MAYTSEPKPAPFAVGERVEYRGATLTLDAVTLKSGMIGTVVAVQEGWRGSGRVVGYGEDGAPYYDETHDDWSVVDFGRGLERAVRHPAARYRRVRGAVRRG